MSVRTMQRVVARILTDPAYQKQFFSDTSHSDAHSLTPAEFATLRQIDTKKLGIVSEGYIGKRFERIESCYPRTLQVLEALDQHARANYLAHTHFPASDEAERNAFMAYLQEKMDLWPRDVQRCLHDLATLEKLLYSMPTPPGPPVYRIEPDRTRPLRTPYAVLFQSKGMVSAAWSSHLATPTNYAYDPHHWLATWDGPRLWLEPLSRSTLDLLEACNGSQTVAELESTFGPEAVTYMKRWFDKQVIAEGAHGT